MILLKHVTPLLRTFPDFSSHVEDFLAGLPQPADSSALRPCGSLDFTPHPFPRPFCSSSGLGAGSHMLQAPTLVLWPPLCPLPGALFPRNLPPMIRWILLQCYPFTEPPLPEPPPCFPASSMMNIHLLVGCKLPEGTLTAFPPYPHPPTPTSSGHSRSEHPKHKLNKESQNIGTCSFTNINLTTTTNEASTTVIFILYTGKLQHREVKSFTQGHTAVSDPSVCLSVCASSHACVASVMG